MPKNGRDVMPKSLSGGRDVKSNLQKNNCAAIRALRPTSLRMLVKELQGGYTYSGREMKTDEKRRLLSTAFLPKIDMILFMKALVIDEEAKRRRRKIKKQPAVKATVQTTEQATVQTQPQEAEQAPPHAAEQAPALVRAVYPQIAFV